MFFKWRLMFWYVKLSCELGKDLMFILWRIFVWGEVLLYEIVFYMLCLFKLRFLGFRLLFENYIIDFISLEKYNEKCSELVLFDK